MDYNFSNQSGPGAPGYGVFGGGGGGGVIEGLLLGTLFGGRGFGNRGGDGCPDCSNLASQLVSQKIDAAQHSNLAQFAALTSNINQGQMQEAIRDAESSARANTANILGSIDRVGDLVGATAVISQSLIKDSIFQTAQSTTQILGAIASESCEIKQKIASDGDLTRALINANTIQGLRDQLCASTLELSQCKQTEQLQSFCSHFDKQFAKQNETNILLGNTITSTLTAVNSLVAARQGA